MTEKVLIHERCLALQLVRDLPPPFVRTRSQQSRNGHPPQHPDLNRQSHNWKHSQLQYSSLRRPKYHETGYSNQSYSVPSSPVKHLESPQAGSLNKSASDSSGTPTPTNPIQKCSPTRSLGSPALNGYQDGLFLYQSWVETNATNVWDEELVRAVHSAHYIGVLTGGYMLVGGAPRTLAAICHAHSRALLSPPPGWIIVLLGEMRECEVTVITKGQFTPLAEALCWVINKLTSTSKEATQVTIRNSLLLHFPAMIPPEPAIIHAALSDLIRQRKVFHSANGYGIVKSQTYSTVPSTQSTSSAPKLLTTSEALTKAHGDTIVQQVGKVTHTAVQTDLADLLKESGPNASVIIPRLSMTGNFYRSNSLKNTHSLNQTISYERNKYRLPYYNDPNGTDITLKGGEKGSVLSKLLRVSQPRSKLASFSGQFPPPQWQNTEEKHLHSVSTQTSTNFPESCWIGNSFWVTRSSSLPRKPTKAPASLSRPHSVSPCHGKNIRKSSDSSKCSTISQWDTSKSGNPPSSVSSHSKSEEPNRQLIKDNTLNSDSKNAQNSDTTRRYSRKTLPRLPTYQKKFDISRTSDLNLSSRNHNSFQQKIQLQNSKQIVNTTDDSSIKKIGNSRPDRASLQLPLKETYMNNSKNVASSPQKPEGLQKNVLTNPAIAKEGCDITSKNLGYIEIDKSKKKMYSTQSSDNTGDTSSTESLTKTQENPETIQNQVKNFPSLSNLNFSSLAAQKIIQGVSMNSIDTIVEVNMVAEKLKSPLDEPVTNTQFGFV